MQVAVQSIRVLQAWYGGFAGKQGTQAEDSSSSRTSTVIALSRCFMNLSKTILMITTWAQTIAISGDLWRC